MRLKPPKIIRRLMPDLIWEIDDPEGVFLTFDDGPTPGITEWILATLDKYDAKATFFVLGKNVEMYPDLFRRIVDAGHKVGNHTYHHPNMSQKDEAPLPMPRARKYYEKAQEIRKGKLNLIGMIDYTRIMMCLYAAIIKNNGKEIQNFDFATSSLKIDDIILAMKEEQDALPFNVIKKKKFDTVDPYGMDAITFILAITLLYKITGENLEGGNENE